VVSPVSSRLLLSICSHSRNLLLFYYVQAEEEVAEAVEVEVEEGVVDLVVEAEEEEAVDLVEEVGVGAEVEAEEVVVGVEEWQSVEE
jgi:hypothetical protein